MMDDGYATSRKHAGDFAQVVRLIDRGNMNENVERPDGTDRGVRDPWQIGPRREDELDVPDARESLPTQSERHLAYIDEDEAQGPLEQRF
jgi:hypothetical protein